MAGSTHFDWDLIRRYDTRGPRYTSYPTALQFSDDFSPSDYEAQVRMSDSAAVRAPLSIYIHIPFCEHLCFYCACNKIATKNRSQAAVYLEYLLREVDLKASLFKPGRRVQQIHFGGGTPTFLTPDQLGTILHRLKTWFRLSDDATGDYSIEIDPRTVTPDNIFTLREMGLNRVSLGIQDFDTDVQKAVHRVQSREQTLAILDAAQAAGMHSINVDLMYGLPRQTVQSVSNTLGDVLRARPGRISLFNYAHLPDRFPAQKRIQQNELPNVGQKWEMLKTSVETLVEAGYVYIGMDHFALPDDELARARQEGTLHRNFQGYTTHSECELIGLGVSSIGQLERCFSQNTHLVEDYQQRIDNGILPITRGVMLDNDDLVRARIINQLMCFGRINLTELNQGFDIDFPAYFRSELDQMESFVSDGLVQMDESGIRVTDCGRMLVRNICSTFDRYLHSHQPARFSKTI